MGWTCVRTAKDVITELKETIEKQASFEYLERMENRIRELMEKVVEFDREYFGSAEDVVRLGYLIIYKPYNIFIKAIIVYGENEPIVGTVDIEEWLRDRDDP
jgi:hypothetical protein